MMYIVRPLAHKVHRMQHNQQNIDHTGMNLSGEI